MNFAGTKLELHIVEGEDAGVLLADALQLKEGGHGAIHHEFTRKKHEYTLMLSVGIRGVFVCIRGFIFIGRPISPAQLYPEFPLQPEQSWGRRLRKNTP